MSQWIKYSDQQPGDEHDGHVLIVAVTDQQGRPISDCAVWNKGIKKKGRFDFWETKITHWQPLPLPPGAQP